MNDIRCDLGSLPAITMTAVMLAMLSGCYQVEYEYDVPESASDCPPGMEHRSGGSAIVDRSGGSGIVDREDADVTDFCYQPTCPGGNYDNTVPAEIDWHLNDHKQVVATRTCLALPLAPPGPDAEMLPPGDLGDAADGSQGGT